jgi:hypothetical protein
LSLRVRDRTAGNRLLSVRAEGGKRAEKAAALATLEVQADGGGKGKIRLIHN